LNRRAPAYLFIALLLFVACGATCPRRNPYTQPVPVAFPSPPTLNDVIRVVNTNSQAVQQLQTDSAKLSAQGMPELRANIAMERPRNFRLQADFMGLRQVLDLGSNHEVFWALVDIPQIATNIPRGIYFARHDQYQRSAARHLVPIEPDWLIDAFGLAYLDPSHVHEGPYARGPEQLVIRSRVPSPDGDLLKITVAHASYGWVLEQHLYDARSQLIGSVLASNHRHYPVPGVTLPHRIQIQLPPPAQPLLIDVASYAINQPSGNPAQLWTMPTYEGYQRFDLAGPQVQPPNPGPPPNQPPPPNRFVPGYPVTGYRPNYRGYSPRR
jgi:hypothetical protein